MLGSQAQIFVRQNERKVHELRYDCRYGGSCLPLDPCLAVLSVVPPVAGQERTLATWITEQLGIVWGTSATRSADQLQRVGKEARRRSGRYGEFQSTQQCRLLTG